MVLRAVVGNPGAVSAVLGAALNNRSFTFCTSGHCGNHQSILGGNNMGIRKFFVELIDVDHVGHTSCLASDFPKNVPSHNRVVELVLRREVFHDLVDVGV